jgi:hypothetical protein
MSIGLGKTQANILFYLRKRNQQASSNELLVNVYDGLLSNSNYKSLLRSLSILRRKGLIRSIKRQVKIPGLKMKHGGRRYEVYHYLVS